jgi:hypothetical protein
MRGLVGCTVATASHLPGALVAAQSWRLLHPESSFWILLADASADAAQRASAREPILTPGDVGLDATEVRVRRAIYSPAEYATSLKPVVVRFLLGQGAEVVIFTDADTNMYAPLDAFAAEAAEAGVCVAPHVLTPLPPDGKSVDELDLLNHGVLNTGLVGVGRSGAAFADWWTARARRDCLDLPWDGFHLEQRWVDLALTQFGARAAMDPGLNVAFWNLHERRLQRSREGWTVNGVPLRHFHFSGFDPTDTRTLTRHALVMPSRVKFDDQPELADVLTEYAARIRAAAQRSPFDACQDLEMTAAGRPLAQREHLLLREAVLAHEAGAAPAPPDPFDPAQQEAFAEFTGTPRVKLALSPEARLRLRRVNWLLTDLGHIGRRDRLTSALAGAAINRLCIPFRGLATASASVLAEYE